MQQLLSGSGHARPHGHSWSSCDLIPRGVSLSIPQRHLGAHVNLIISFNSYATIYIDHCLPALHVQRNARFFHSIHQYFIIFTGEIFHYFHRRNASTGLLVSTCM